MLDISWLGINVYPKDATEDDRESRLHSSIESWADNTNDHVEELRRIHLHHSSKTKILQDIFLILLQE